MDFANQSTEFIHRFDDIDHETAAFNPGIPQDTCMGFAQVVPCCLVSDPLVYKCQNA